MGAVTWSVTADLDLDGSFETDLTGYVEMPGSGIRIQRGAGLDGLQRTSSVSITLSNRGGEFTPEDSSATFYGSLDTGTPIRVTGTHSATPYTFWTGYIQDKTVRWDAAGVSLVELQCVDLSYYLTNSLPVNVSVATDRDTDAAMVAIMTALGYTGSDYSFDDGIQDFPVHFANGQNGMEALANCLRSELGGALYVNASGLLRFENRQSRRGTSVDDTWGDGTSIIPRAEAYILQDDWVVENVRAKVFTYKVETSNVEVWRDARWWANETPDSLELVQSQIYEREYSAGVAYLSLATPTALTDYTANTAIDATGTDITSSLTVTVTDLGGGKFRQKLANGYAGTMYVTFNRVRGIPVPFAGDSPEIVFSLPVPTRTAGRGAQMQLQFCGDGASAQDYAYSYLRTYRYPAPVLQLTFDASNDAKKAALLGVELGDLIKYDIDSLAASKASKSNDWWYVDSIAIEIPPNLAGQTFRATVGLVPSYLYRDLDQIVWDVFNRGNATGDLGVSSSGATWANDTAFDITSETARASSDVLQMPNLELGASGTDQVIEVTLAAIGTGDEVGVVFRYADANNQYRAYVDKGSNEVILEKNVASSVTEISSPAFTVGTSHEIRVLNQSTRIRVWVDRKLYIDTTDSGLSAGTKVGLFARNANGTTTFDNFYGQRL